MNAFHVCTVLYKHKHVFQMNNNKLKRHLTRASERTFLSNGKTISENHAFILPHVAFVTVRENLETLFPSPLFHQYVFTEKDYGWSVMWTQHRRRRRRRRWFSAVDAESLPIHLFEMFLLFVKPYSFSSPFRLNFSLSLFPSLWLLISLCLCRHYQEILYMMSNMFRSIVN